MNNSVRAYASSLLYSDIQSLHSSYRTAILKKFESVLSPVVLPSLEGVTLEVAYAILGRATYRLQVIEEIRSLINHAMGWMMGRQYIELLDLADSSKRQVALSTQLIRGLYQEEAKNAEQIPAGPAPVVSKPSAP